MTRLFKSAAGMGLPSSRYARLGQAPTGDLQKRRYTIWDDQGNLRFNPISCKFRNSIADGVIRKSNYNIVDWFSHLLSLDLSNESSLIYTPGAIFAVRKSLIYSRSLDFYNKLLYSVSDYKFVEECWFLEQAWLYIFNSQVSRIRTLCRSANPNAVYLQ
jgi:hypothetical protein